MKKILMILVTLCAACTMQAQDRTIKMPTEKGKTSFNPAEQEKGYWCALEVGGGATTMEGRKNLPMGEIIFSNGYRINQYLKVGVGIGALYYIANNNEVRGTTRKLSMPLFATLRGNFLNEDTRSVVPYWTANVGALGWGRCATPSSSTSTTRSANSRCPPTNISITAASC